MPERGVNGLLFEPESDLIEATIDPLVPSVPLGSMCGPCFGEPLSGNWGKEQSYQFWDQLS